MKKNKTLEMNAPEENPLDLLKEEPGEGKSLFEKFEQAERLAQKEEIVRSVAQDFKNHPPIEKGFFYPAAWDLMRHEKAPDPVGGALDEYRAVDLLIQELEGMDTSEVHEDVQFIILGENVRHPAGEEEEGSKKKRVKRLARKKVAKPGEAFLEKAA